MHIAFDFGMDSQGVLKDLNVSEEVLRSETDKAVEELGDRRAKIIRDELGKCGKYSY